LALNNATLPGALALANEGWQGAMQNNPHLMAGLNVCQGKVTYQAVAQSLGLEYSDPQLMLRS
jgi:alanine dehydrogenase